MLDFNTSLLLKIISSLFFLISGIIWKKVLVCGDKNYHYIIYRVIATLFFFLLIKYYFQYNEIENFNKVISVITFKDWIVCISICLGSIRVIRQCLCTKAVRSYFRMGPEVLRFNRVFAHPSQNIMLHYSYVFTELVACKERYCLFRPMNKLGENRRIEYSKESTPFFTILVV